MTTQTATPWQIISVHGDGWWGPMRAPLFATIEEARAHVLANAAAFGYGKSNINVMIRNTVLRRRWTVEPRPAVVGV